jgi:hypothetical protein
MAVIWGVVVVWQKFTNISKVLITLMMDAVPLKHQFTDQIARSDNPKDNHLSICHHGEPQILPVEVPTHSM